MVVNNSDKSVFNNAPSLDYFVNVENNLPIVDNKLKCIPHA